MSEKDEILKPVFEKIQNVKESLKNIKRFKQMGIEGWFKIVVISALNDIMKSINNNGADITLRDDRKIELKAATDLNVNYIIKGATYYNSLCLFLGDGNNEKSIEKIRNCKGIETIGVEIFEVDNEKWVVGLIKPK